MSRALMRRNSSSGGSGSTGKGVVSGVASGVVPGLGQLINGEGDKALGVFAVSAIAGLGLWSAIPILGPVAGLVGGATWLYGVADGYLTGKRGKRR
ncbi:MAG: hypothetical protein KC503_40340 [Myxococcales bacterium]|nr:hypothetical protein [Myxococcales bacterium]